MTKAISRLALVVSFLTIALIPAATAGAQGVQTGTLTGVARDDTGGALPGVLVTVTSPALQGVRTSVSDGQGLYLLSGLPAGVYTVTFQLEGFATASQTARVPLGATAELNATLQLGAVTEEVIVTAQAPSPLATLQGGINLVEDTVDALPMGRTLARVAELAPGLTDNGPRSDDRQQLTIGGAFAFDNVFLLNGVDVNDNIWGGPENLFIEDAIEETQVLTSGVSAEYGRFTGGVINAITRSGGNVFSGSVRANLANPSWIAETPFERSSGITRESDLSKYFEETLGGPIVRDRLWFFFGGRNERSSSADALNDTGVAYTRKTSEDRYLIKLTGTPAPGHRLQGSFLNNSSETYGPSTTFSIDPNTLVTRQDPARLLVATYNGVLGPRWLAEMQVSQKVKETKEDRTASTDLRDSSFFSADFSVLRQYNAPHFDFVNDPEERNNRQITGNLQYFLSTDRTGSHAFKFGAEYFVATRIGGNSQSQTGFTYDALYKTDDTGAPVFDGQGRMIPLWVPGGGYLETIVAQRGASLDITTSSVFVQDDWRLNDRWSFNIGFRFENVSSDTTGVTSGIDTTAFVPRLGVSYDIKGNGRQVLKATYGHYAGSYNPVLIGQNSKVGNPAIFYSLYDGPEGEGIDFAPGLDHANYVPLGFCGPCAPENVSFDNVSSPITREFTLSAGSAFGRAGHLQVTYVNRSTSNFIDDVITPQTGTTTVVQDGVEVGTFVNRVYRNTDALTRDYQALVFEGRHGLTDNWSIDGTWTVQLENDGNFEGQSAANPAEPSPFGNYSELLSAARHYPTGHLDGFQRHKVRVWTTYDLDLGGAGAVDLAGIWRYDSGRVFSYLATASLTDIQRELGAQYFSLGDVSRQTIYFGERGSGQFDGAGLVDFAATYSIPVWQSLEPWLKVEVYNLFGNDTLTGYDTSISPVADGPTDALGLPTTYVQGPRFGEATSTSHFPAPFPGETGGRAFQMAFGLRF